MGYVILLWHSLSLPYNYFVFGALSVEALSVVGNKKENTYYIFVNLNPAVEKKRTINKLRGKQKRK